MSAWKIPIGLLAIRKKVISVSKKMATTGGIGSDCRRVTKEQEQPLHNKNDKSVSHQHTRATQGYWGIENLNPTFSCQSYCATTSFLDLFSLNYFFQMNALIEKNVDDHI